jgi:hypothetical protein
LSREIKILPRVSKPEFLGQVIYSVLSIVFLFYRQPSVSVPFQTDEFFYLKARDTSPIGPAPDLCFRLFN